MKGPLYYFHIGYRGRQDSQRDSTHTSSSVYEERTIETSFRVHATSAYLTVYDRYLCLATSTYPEIASCSVV